MYCFKKYKLNGRHPITSHYTKGEEKKRRRIVAEEPMVGMERAFISYEHSFTTMMAFKSLGRTLNTFDDDLMSVVANLLNA